MKMVLLGMALLLGTDVFALEKEPPCYDLTAEDAAAILNNELVMIQDKGTRWNVVKVGLGLTCLDYCPVGSFEVSDVVVKNGRCVYTIKNGAPQQVLGECTTITLKPSPHYN